MDILNNPRIAPQYLIGGSLLLLAIGAVASQTRLATVAYESSNAQISAYRVNSCRVLEGSDKLILGAYYYQPTGNTGQWLSEGTYLCDLYGNSGRIDRGGYLQYLVPGDAAAMNKTLKTRLDDESNPDHNPNLRVRRDRITPIYVAPSPTPTPENSLFPQ